MTRKHHILVATVLLAACTPIRPQVELTTGVSLQDYHVFEVAPVEDASGYTLFPWPIEDSLRLRLVEQLAHHKLTVRTTEADSANTAGVLVLKGLVAAGVGEFPAQAAAIVLVTPVNFLGNKLWSFKVDEPVDQPLA